MEWSKEKIFRFMYQIDTEDEENIYFFLLWIESIPKKNQANNSNK